MKIDNVEIITCPAGWRAWDFLRVSTDTGIVGFSDITDSNGAAPAVIAAVKMFGESILGRDPRQYEQVYSDLYRSSRQSAGGVVHKALAGIDNCLLDITAQSFDVPVYALLNGPSRDTVDLYWSHCATTRVRHAAEVGQTRPTALTDFESIGKEVSDTGYRAAKTNLIMLGDPPTVISQGFRGPLGSSDRLLGRLVPSSVLSVIEALKAGMAPDGALMLDINMHLRTEGVVRLAHELADVGLHWLEVDLGDPHALRYIRERATMPIASGEGLFTPSSYKPYLDAGAMDVALVDVRWAGLRMAKRIADLALLYEINVAPHNHGSPLSTLMSAHFCAAVSNLHHLEYDVDDVPWRDSILGSPLQIQDGQLRIPMGRGWGAEINEEVIRTAQLS